MQRRNFGKAVKAGVKMVVRDGLRCLPVRGLRTPVCVHGEVRHDADAGDSIRDHQRGDIDRQAGRVRFDSRR